MSTTEFIRNFHALPGQTPGEKRKELYLLCKTTNEVDLSSLNPKDQLEEIFKTEALIYFKKTKELFQLLKADNPIVVNRVLKSGGWFIREAFKDIGGDQLATEVFPAISFNTKEKLLTQLAAYIDDPIKADGYIEAIEKNYSLYLAQRLLQACSSKTILRYISKRKTEVTPGQLLTIIKKHPQHIEEIFKKLNSQNSKLSFTAKYSSVFRYLAKNDTTFFLQLFGKYKPSFRSFGKRATRKFILKAKKDVIEDPSKFLYLVRFNHAGRSLEAEDFRTFYENFFPKSIERFKLNIYTLNDLTKYMKSKPAQLRLLLETFKKVHKNDLWEYSDLVSRELIEMMSPDERHAWIEVHEKPDCIPEETWVSYMKLKKSIPLLKNKISLSASVNTRTKLIRALVATCKLNDDVDELMGVLEYVMKNHRNDKQQVIDEMFGSVSSSFDLTKFNDTQWEVLLKCAQTIKAIRGTTYQLREIDQKYIEYRLQKGLPIAEQLIQWIKGDPSPTYGISMKNPHHEKRCLMEFCTLPNWDETSSGDKLIYLSTVLNWNALHKNHRISFFVNPKNMEAVKNILLGRESSYYSLDYNCYVVAYRCIVLNFETCQKMQLLEALAEHEKKSNYYWTDSTLQWMLRNKPHALPRYKEIIKEVILNKGKFYKHNRYLKIWKEIAEELLEMLRANHEKIKEKTKKRMVVEFLTYVLQPEEVLQVVSSYYPTELSPNLESDDEQNLYWIQQAFMWYIRNVARACPTLETILRFCQGDYLKLSVVSLYCTAHRVPECKLQHFLDVLTEKAVSVRKHALSIGFRTLQNAQASKILHHFMSSEKNVSIRKILFKTSFRCFLQKPNELTWKLTKDNLEKVDKDDGEAFEFLATSGSAVHRSYFTEYFTHAWATLKTLPASNKMSVEGKSKLLETIKPEVVPELPEEFRKEVIEMLVNDSVNKSSGLHESVKSAVAKCIVYMQPAAARRNQIDTTILRIQNFTETKTIFARKTVYDFIKELCSECLNEGNKDAKCEVLCDFLNVWSASFELHKVVDERLHMQFTLIYLKTVKDKPTVADIAREIVTVCDGFYNKGLFVLTVFTEILQEFFGYFYRNDPEGDCVENRTSIIEGVLQHGSTAGSLLLATSLLPSNIENKIFKTRYENLIRVMSQSDHPDVQIYLNHYFSSKNW